MIQNGIVQCSCSWPNDPLTTKSGKSTLVRFERPFPAGSPKPSVFVGFSTLDVTNGANTRIKVETSDITHDGFWVSFGTWADSKVWSVGVNWFAISSDKHAISTWTQGPPWGIAKGYSGIAPRTRGVVQAVPLPHAFTGQPLALALTLIDLDKPPKKDLANHGVGLDHGYSGNHLFSLQANNTSNYSTLWQASVNVLLSADKPPYVLAKRMLLEGKSSSGMPTGVVLMSQTGQRAIFDLGRSGLLFSSLATATTTTTFGSNSRVFSARTAKGD